MSAEYPTIEVEVDGQKFNVRAWTVKERLDFLKRLANSPRPANPTSPTVEESEATMNFAVEFVAEQSGLTKESVFLLPATTFDRLFAEIVRANSAPKAPSPS